MVRSAAAVGLGLLVGLAAVARPLAGQGGPPRDTTARRDTTTRRDSTARPAPLVPLAPTNPAAANAAANAARDLLGDNLGLRLNARLESKMERLKNDRCTAAQRTILGNNCNGLWNPIFDVQFDLKSKGTVGDRLAVDVDYNSQNEFDANNTIGLRYNGKPTSWLQSLQVGNVSFVTPASRFLTAGIPAGNYGVQAEGKWGPMRFSGIVAQQKGLVSRDNLYTIGGRTQQAVNRVIEDMQIEPRRFFFTIDPRRLGGFPNIDILNRARLRQLASTLPDSVRPVKLVVYRQDITGANQNPRGPQLSVRGARNSARQTYEVLREGVDYYVDPTLLWIVLVQPLIEGRERLAVAYEVNVAGTPGRNENTGGTPDFEFTAAPQYANLLWEPELQPANAAYFLREIKSVYRLGGADLRRESLALRIVTGTSGDQEKPLDPSRGETYLRLFGVAQATNPALLDVENRVWPRPNDPNVRSIFSGLTQDALIRDQFLIFPSLQPFARAGLAQPFANPANDTLYSFPNEYFNTAQRPQAIYRLMLHYETDIGAGDATGDTRTITLPTTQIRRFSERVVLDGRDLVRDRDYTIEYDLGLITFARADTLFATARQVSVRYEENPQFQVTTPTTILGFNSTFPLENGQFAFTAISQRQRSSLTRPSLGLEPMGSLVAGVTGNLHWDATAISKALERLPLRPSTTPSRIGLRGEFAVSKPQPNAAGQAYLESFEGAANTPISLAESNWYFASRPALGSTFAGQGSSTLALNRAATLAYQNFGVSTTGGIARFTQAQIDPSVRLVGSGADAAAELLWLTLYPLKTGGIFDQAPGSAQRRFAWTIGDRSQVGLTPSGRRWRSIRRVLSPSGQDLSAVENVEFFVLVHSEQAKLRRNPTLVFDFGEVSENSVTFAPETLTVTGSSGARPDSTYRGKRLVGFDRLDTERDPLTRSFNAIKNDVGLAGDVADTLVVVDRTGATPVTTIRNGVPLCTQAVAAIQALGDSRVNCTVRNNRMDEEDIDLDGQLNLNAASVEQEAIKRFTVDLSDKRTWTRIGGCIQQRDSTSTGVTADSLCWVQVRLNWRAPTEVLNAPNERRMRALRVTMVSNALTADDDFVRIAIANLRLPGAPWLKRSAEPLSGMAGDSSGTVGGYVIAGVVGTTDSTATLPYASPPGVVDAPETRLTGYEVARTQVNERALRLQAGLPGRQFRTFDRAEAFFRFRSGTQTFMGYRTLRLWMRGRGNGWGPNGELNGYIKIGRDENNFYMYRTPVNTGESQSAWLPEVRVDLTRFQLLRAQLENAFLQGSKDSIACTGADLELVKRSGKPRGVNVRRYAVCQDGYIVYSADPAVTPPNLAGVQELAVGIVRVDSVPRGGGGLLASDTLELWVNDIRLGDVVDDIGMAGEIGLNVNAGDYADVRVSMSRRDPNFRQLGETPTFLTTSGVSVGTTLHLERFLPANLGFAMPFSIDYSGTGIDQLFVNRTDVRASGIQGLRRPSDKRTSYSFSLRRATPLANGWYAPLVNALNVSGSWSNMGSQSAFQEANASAYNLGGGLALESDERTHPMPGVITALTNVLPSRWRNSAAVKAWREQKVRWSPTQFRLNSAVARNAITTTSFVKAAAALNDTGQVVSGLNNLWSNTAALEFRPIPSIGASVNARQLLDLRDYRDAFSNPLTPFDSVNRGIIAEGERLRLFGRDAGLERERSLSSSLLFQPQLRGWWRPRADFTSTFGLTKDPNALVLLRADDTTGTFRLPRRLGAAQTLGVGSAFDVGQLLVGLVGAARSRWLSPIDVQWQQSLTSNYDNTSFIPGWGYQFGMAGISTFRGLDRRLATSAGRLQRTTVATELRLPLSFTLRARAEQGTSEAWTQRSVDGTQALITGTQVVRPDLNLAWNWQPARWKALISSVILGGGYTYREQIASLPNDNGLGTDLNRTLSFSQPLSASITWSGMGNLRTTGRLTRQHREDQRPGALITGDSRQVGFSVERSLPLPTTWNTRTGRMQTALSYQSETARSEIVGASRLLGLIRADRPAVLTDNGRRAINLNASTDLSELLTFNLTGSHVVSFDRTINRQFSNLVFSAVLQMKFFAGELR
ncbi:MAG: cell surface protein SprA [Gemmatimonadaceae bacterium]|nr:cell surface protein SprA [Gemmatimonadaceae bacterium]